AETLTGRGGTHTDGAKALTGTAGTRTDVVETGTGRGEVHTDVADGRTDLDGIRPGRTEPTPMCRRPAPVGAVIGDRAGSSAPWTHSRTQACRPSTGR